MRDPDVQYAKYRNFVLPFHSIHTHEADEAIERMDKTEMEILNEKTIRKRIVKDLSVYGFTVREISGVCRISGRDVVSILKK